MFMDKKGFTIVELVIVIAVIAILSAVLIPSFTDMVRKADMTVDTTLAREFNYGIAMTDSRVDNFEQAISVLRKYGFLIANLKAKTEGCYFVWEDKTNQFLFVDADDDFKVIYSNGLFEPIGETWCFAVSTPEQADALLEKNANVKVKMTVLNTAVLREIVNRFGECTVYIDESTVVDSNEAIVINQTDAKITVEFGNATVSGSAQSTMAIENLRFILNAGELTIRNGIIACAEGTTVEANGGKLVVDGTTFDGGESGNKIIAVNTGANVTLRNCNIDGKRTLVDVAYKTDEGSQESPPLIVIEGGCYQAITRELLRVCQKSTIIIKNGSFVCLEESLFKFSMMNATVGSKIILEDGVYNYIDFLDLNLDGIRGMISGTEDGFDITVTPINNTFVLELVAIP